MYRNKGDLLRIISGQTQKRMEVIDRPPGSFHQQHDLQLLRELAHDNPLFPETTMNPEQIKAQFRREGKTFAAFARDNGYRLGDVYRVLNGQYKGHYGKAHEIAVKLGMKPTKHEAA